jgi:hypothetical protein
MLAASHPVLVGPVAPGDYERISILGPPGRVAQELLRHAPWQQDDDGVVRSCKGNPASDAAELLPQALTGPIQSVTQSVTDPEDGVVWSGTESPTGGIPRGKVAPAVVSEFRT